MNGLSHRSYDRLTRDNSALLLIDYQVGLLWDMNAPDVTRSALALARAAKILGVPTIVTATVPQFWGPTLPELVAALPGAGIINRTAVNPWTDSAVRTAVQQIGRSKLIISGFSVDVAVALAALAARADGFDVYVAMDASGSVFPDPQTTVAPRLMQAGVIVANAGPLVLEMLDDCADARARDVYTALDLPFAPLLAQPFSPDRPIAPRALPFTGTILSEGRRMHTHR